MLPEFAPLMTEFHTAMHDDQQAYSSVRISVGRANEEEQIEEAAQRIADAAEQLRAFAL